MSSERGGICDILKRFRVSLTARAGVGWFNVFATYSLTPLFESGSGPELYPFSVGVTLVGF